MTAAAALAAAAVLLPASAISAEPASGTVSADSRIASWSGDHVVFLPAGDCAPPATPNCEAYTLTVAPGDYTGWKLKVSLDGTDGDIYGLYVTRPNNAGEPSAQGDDVDVTIADPAPGVYNIAVYGFVGVPLDPYTGSATLIAPPTAPPPGAKDSVLHSYDEKAAKGTFEAPLRIVLVGFKPGELDPAKLTAQIPATQRPGVLIPHGEGLSPSGDDCMTGLETLINHGRCYYMGGGDDPFLVPVEVKWKPQVIFASDAFTDGLFSTMAANSTTGEFDGRNYRPYLEHYNARRGQYRGAGNEVPPMKPVRFVDAEKTEDWIAANASKLLGFELGPKGGAQLGPGKNPGYTIFVLNTWDSPQAIARLKPQNEYHVFKVNRVDPDTGQFAGVDWARVWGGRYRDMIMDLGAAPNPYEGETWGNNGDNGTGSASFDPPLWEFRANADKTVTPGNIGDSRQLEGVITPGATWTKADLEWNIARFAMESASYRFMHSYLYEPRPQTGKYHISSNVWHDAKSDQPWPSDLSKLYNASEVLKGLRTLVPYFSFTEDTKWEYLSEAGGNHVAEQDALDRSKAEGNDPLLTNGEGKVPHSAMNTETMMDFLDATPSQYVRGGPECATPVPNIAVAVEKHYAWALPLIVAGIATNRNGKPWGFLSSVNDATKWSGADKPEGTLAAAHPDSFSGTFTYTSVHELSHYLGLAHPHDTVGAWRDPSTGKTEYFDGFTWTFNSTAAPTTYAFGEMKYSILDQETIARGHYAYYISWTDEALAEGGVAYDDQGIKTTKKLPKDAAKLRSTAISSMAKAKKLFSGYEFVKAVFEAQKAYRAAASYRDMALKLAPGTTELERGTRAAGAAGCASASKK